MSAPPKVRIPPALIDTASALDGLFLASGVEAYGCGGFIRDLLLRREITDLDISVTGDPLELGPLLAEAIGGNYFPLDEQRRHARILLNDSPVHVDLLPLRGSIEDDLQLRDFTIDALAAPLPDLARGTANLIDPTGGVSDLNARLIRVVAEQALVDDPLRMLRGVRLAAQLDFVLEPDTARLIRRHAALIQESAPERQRDELMSIVATTRAAPALRLLDDLGLLSPVMPDLDVMRGVEQPKEHTWDVFGHSIEAVAVLDWLLLESEPEDELRAGLWRELWSQLAWWTRSRSYWREELSPGMTRADVLKLTALLHDIGKPQTKSVEAGGRIRFFGHSDAGAEIASKIVRRLRFPGRVVAHVKAMIDAHLRPLQMALEGPPTRRAVYRFFRDTGGAGFDTLFLSLADHLATVGPRVTPAGWRRHVAVVGFILATHLERRPPAGPQKLVAGEDLMDAFGLQPGPLVGELLQAIREAQAAGEVTTKQDAVDVARQYLIQSHAQNSSSPADTPPQGRSADAPNQ